MMRDVDLWRTVKNKVFHNDINAVTLLEKIRARKLVVFVGSGLSSGIGGYPAWGNLVSMLCEECRVSVDLPLTHIAGPEELQDLAEKAYDASPLAYVSVLKREFARRVTETKRVYDLLVRAPFLGYITTNFDPLLSIELGRLDDRSRKLHVYPEIEPLDMRNRDVFHIHGLISEDSDPDPSKIVLRKSDFELAYGDKGPLPLFWEIVLQRCEVLFLGCGLGEPELFGLFAHCNAVRQELSTRFGIQKKSRYALLPVAETRLAENATSEENDAAKLQAEKEEQRFSEYGITVVRYDARGSSYAGLVDVLEECAPPSQPNIFREEIGAP